MRITYEIITPESAEHGDADERGFVEPRFDMHVPIEEVMANGQDWPKESLRWTLRHAEIFLGRNGMEDNGRWFTALDGNTNYQTGAETRYSLHPDDNTTPASYDRLKRIFCHASNR